MESSAFRLEIVEGDLSQFAADGIVNAASHSLLGTAGVSGAVFAAAGPELRAECAALGGCEPGEARITAAYQLPARYVIHTVAPVWYGGSQGEADLLARCYRRCLQLVEQYALRTVAFPALGTGAHGFPLDQAIRIAVREMLDFLRGNSTLERIFVVCYGASTAERYRAEIAKQVPSGCAADLPLKIHGSTLNCVHIAPGEFTMGSTRGLPLELPPHHVTIERPFFLGECLVTQQVWKLVMGENSSSFRDQPNLPVDSVSWDQAKEFCRRVTDLTGRNIRLPSEAEWEYACRAGTTTEYFFGDQEARVDEWAWYEMNSQDRSHPVGTKRPNPWGLYDMTGNLWEWCEDVWHCDYNGAPADGRAWTADEERQPRRTLRGAAWDMDAFRCRSAYRSYDWRSLGTSRFGLRIAVDA